MAVTPILKFDDVQVGDEAPVVSHPLGRSDLVRYAGASGDYNPMHTDEVAAQDAGLPSVFGHGMFSMGLLGRALTDWAGPGNLTNYRVRFIKRDVAVVDALLTVRNANGPDGTIIPAIPVIFFYVAVRHADRWLIQDGRTHFAAAPPSNMIKSGASHN